MPTSHPRFSIILPTFQRADTLTRAIASVRAQTFRDFELVVVDHSPTDETADLLDRLREPWLRVLYEEDQGVARARNTGLRAARGELIAFLDSDDEWLPHHLALMGAFFDAFPDESLASAEWLEVDGAGATLRHPRVELGHWYPATAARIGSTRFSTPPSGADPYLAFYAHGAPIGAWADRALAGTRLERPRHYQGNLFEHWRWGWLTALEATVLRRGLVEQLGPFDESYAVAADFPWLARACELARLNLLAAPTHLKHQLTRGGLPPHEDHLVSAHNAVAFHEEVLRALDGLFASRLPDDPELRAVFGLRHRLTGEWALHLGDRDRALLHLDRALSISPGPELVAARERALALPEGKWLAWARRAVRGALAPDHHGGAAVRRLDTWMDGAPAGSEA